MKAEISYEDQYVGRTEQDLASLKASNPSMRVGNDGLTVSNFLIVFVCVILTIMSEGRTMSKLSIGITELMQ
jgi:hypothetical protein